MSNTIALVYYIGGGEYQAIDDIQRAFNKLGNFGKLSLTPGKLCSRLELLVSPACKQFDGVYFMDVDGFEVVEEDQHVGK